MSILDDFRNDLIERISNKNFCYTATISPQGFMVGVVVENESGYYQTSWVFPTYKEAQDVAEMMNNKLKLDNEQVYKIICSSMRLGKMK